MPFDPLSLIPVMFQFHKGSINTDEGQSENDVQHQFQFHKGSINTSF